MENILTHSVNQTTLFWFYLIINESDSNIKYGFFFSLEIVTCTVLLVTGNALMFRNGTLRVLFSAKCNKNVIL